MTHQSRAGIGLVRLGDSDFVPANPEDDVRGKDVYDPEGQRIGGVEDIYIDPQEREVRYLEIGFGGFLRMGEKPILVPVEAVTRVTENRVNIEPGRTEKVDGPAPFDTRIAPPRADEPREDHTSPQWDYAERTADQRREIHSSFPYGGWPY